MQICCVIFFTLCDFQTEETNQSKHPLTLLYMNQYDNIISD